MIVCRRICAHSPSSSGPGLATIAGSIAILPTSWSSAARRTRARSSGSTPRRAATPAASSRDVERVLGGLRLLGAEDREDELAVALGDRRGAVALVGQPVLGEDVEQHLHRAGRDHADRHPAPDHAGSSSAVRRVPATPANACADGRQNRQPRRWSAARCVATGPAMLPSSRSSWRICALTPDWLTCTRWAAG